MLQLQRPLWSNLQIFNRLNESEAAVSWAIKRFTSSYDRKMTLKDWITAVNLFLKFVLVVRWIRNLNPLIVYKSEATTEPKHCLNRILNFKFDSFVVIHVWQMAPSSVENLTQV
jgi:hypothetical protein